MYIKNCNIMEVKINNNGEMLDATIEMVDGVMVVSPKEVKFEPKDGDVVTVTTKSGGNYTCFFKGNVIGNVYSYGGLNNLYNMLFDDELVCISEKLKTIYPATEGEKKKLFDKLKEEDLEWDAEKKELVKLKWNPKEGEQFWFPLYYAASIAFSPISSLFNNRRDIMFLDKGWCFKTKEECQEFCNRLNYAINSVKP